MRADRPCAGARPLYLRSRPGSALGEDCTGPLGAALPAALASFEFDPLAETLTPHALERLIQGATF